jgi:DNA-directed RNA polymerase specialized sigma24 family protein
MGQEVSSERKGNEDAAVNQENESGQGVLSLGNSKPNMGQVQRGPLFETELARCDQVFDALPPLGSDDYVRQIKTTSAINLPPQVLARAFRQLPPGSPAANATLSRLIGEEDEAGYLAPVLGWARRRLRKRRDMEPEDLVQATRWRIAKTLGSSRGKGAETVWLSYLYQQFIDACRDELGRRATTNDDLDFVEPTTDENGEELNPLENVSADVVIPWHGTATSDTVWLAQFLEQTIEEIADADLRAVGRLIISGERYEKSELARALGITRWVLEPRLRSVLARIRAALETQSDRPNLDISFLER